jgi:hypothetical protein
MKNRSLDHSDHWQTPVWLYDQLDAEFGFDFDPCPLHADFDGLTVPWGKCNFVNPPYSRKLKEAFVARAVEEQHKGNTSVCLLPVSTSTKLFHEVILPNQTDIRFLKGRVSFLGVNTKGEYVTDKKPMHDSMVVVFKGVDNQVDK